MVASGQFEITVSDAEENEKEEGQPQEEAEKRAAAPQRSGHRDIKGGHLAECDCRMFFPLVLQALFG